MKKEPRVLIVEDHEVLKVMLFTILRNQPLAVDTASTVDDAIARVTACDYALILIDMDLEGGAANSFLQRFAEERPNSTTFIIAVRDPRNEAFLDAERVPAVLSKPLEINTLAEVVRECAEVVPPPADPLPCPPAESESDTPKNQMSYLAN